MKIKVLKKINYKGSPIYIRRLDKVFEYLIIYRKELYSHYIDVKPVWYKHFFKELYTEQQLDKIVKLLIIGAQTTIDGLQKNAKT